MKFLQLCRRIHLYLGLALLPWFFLYGVSSIPFSHAQFFDQRFKNSGQPQWRQLFDKTYEAAVPEGNDLRPFADKVVADHGISGNYGAYRQGPNQINVYVWRPFESKQLKYYIQEKRLVGENRTFRFEHFLTGLHAKGGFEQPGLWNWLWSIIVDLACLGMLTWVATGLLMWWQLPSTRTWGWVAFLAGWASFALFLWRL